MRSEDAVEIVRASLALAFPTASAEGLTRAAETVIRWGAEDVAESLNGPLSTRMLLDVMDVAGVSPQGYPTAEPNLLSEAAREMAANYRTWSPSEGMEPLNFLPRPPDEPTPPHDPPAPRR